MALEISDSLTDVRKVLDLLMANYTALDLEHRSIEISTTAGHFTGQLVQRAGEFVQLKEIDGPLRAITQGPQKGMRLERYHVIQLEAIRAVSFTGIEPA